MHHLNREDEADCLVMSVGLWGCSIFRNSENRENPVFIGICMWILMVAFGRDSAARRPLAAGRWLGATPHLHWFRWGARCGIAALATRRPCGWLALADAAAGLPGNTPGPAATPLPCAPASAGPGRSHSSTSPPGRDRDRVLCATAKRREWYWAPAPYAAVAFPGPHQGPLGVLCW